MALNYVVARTLLKEFVAQEPNCPEYFCPDIATIGLSYNTPVATGTDTNPKYYTYELRASTNETGTEIPLPSGVVACIGYERDILGEISGSTVIEHLKKMSSPATEGTAPNTSEETHNTDILVLGENIGSANWQPIAHFILCNTDGVISAGGAEDVESSGTYKGVRISSGLVIFGTINSGETATVTPGTVPLFRKSNFKLTFSTN